MASPASQMPARTLHWGWVVGLFVFVALLGGWGMAELGLLTEAELPVWDRARAAAGEPLEDLVRQPWLPARLRALGYASFGPELGLRLPGLLATALSAAMLLCLALRLFQHVGLAALACGFYLSFLVVGAQANFAAGGALLEACIATFLVAALFALCPVRRAPRSSRALAGLVASLAWCGALSSGGIVLGGALPLLVLAAASPDLLAGASGQGQAPGGAAPRQLAGLPTRVRSVALFAGIACVALGVWLVHEQGEGFIPVLAAAKKSALVDHPLRRHFTASIEELGRQVFPFAALVLAGLVFSRPARWAGRWLAIGLLLCAAWSALYGTSFAGLALPTALACAGAVQALVDRSRGQTLPRLILLVSVGGVWVASKDAQLRTSQVSSPVHRYSRKNAFPSKAIQAPEILENLARNAWLLLFAAYALAHLSRAPSPRPDQDDPPLSRAAVLCLLLMLAHQSWVSWRELPCNTAAHLSLHDLFARHGAGLASGALPETLAMHRVRDRGLELYGPAEDTREVLSSRRSVRDWLAEAEPRVALLRRSDFPGVYQLHREQGWPLHLLDDAHYDLKLVANFEAAGFEVVDPLKDIVLDELPQLEHETFVRFDQHVEVVGWQIEGDVERGGEVTVSLALKVLRPLSAGAEIYVRLQQGRMSKINLEPHRPAGGLYPANNWRRGDVILDRFTFKIPSINTMPGVHDLFVGVRRSKKKNLEITQPEGREGEFGVTLRGRTGREFANIGKIDLR